MTKKEFKQAVIDGLCEGCDEKTAQKHIYGVNENKSFLDSFYNAGVRYGIVEEKLKEAILNFKWLTYSSTRE